MSRRKKRGSVRTKRRPDKLTPLERELADRIMIGLGPIGDVQAAEDAVVFYVLNPGVRGSHRLAIHEATTWPAFTELPVDQDVRMREELRIDASAEFPPFWMKRFAASVDDGDIVFGYVFGPPDRSRLTLKTLSFDGKMVDVGLGAFNIHEHAIARGVLFNMIEGCVGLLADGVGIPCDVVHCAAVAMGAGMFKGKGGES